MRPVDLARQHGLSTQAVRNYEDAGIIPPAQRSRAGYRDYTATHAAGLTAYLALIPAFGYSTSRRVDESCMPSPTASSTRHWNTSTMGTHSLLATATRYEPSKRRSLLWEPPPRMPRPALRRRTASESSPGTSGSTRPPCVPGNALESSPHNETRAPGTASTSRWTCATPNWRTCCAGGGQPLGAIATVLGELRDAGSLEALARTLEGWRRDLTSRGMAQLHAASQLSTYLDALDRSAREPAEPEPRPVTHPGRPSTVVADAQCSISADN